MKKLLASIGTALTLFTIPTVLAQQPAVTQSMTLPLGYVFEVLAVKDQADATVSWTLTKDGNFLQAGRDDIFRTRLVRAGLYTLSGEIISIDGSRSARKMLSITVMEDSNVPAVGSGNSLLTSSDPIADSSGRMLLVSGQDFVTLTPNQNLSSELLLDLDASVDTNGDGIATNDQNAADSFFSTRRTPLFLWIPTVTTTRTIIIAAQDATSATIQLQLVPNGATDSSSSGPLPLPPTSGSGAIGITVLDNNRVRFALNVSGKPYASNPLLLQWNFGDGLQSLLDTPVHSYARDGAYNVRVQVRDLTTNQIVEQFEGTVEVTGIPVIPEPEPEPEPTTGGDTGGAPANGNERSLLELSLKLLVVAFISVVVGYGLMFVIGLIRRRGSFASVLDKAESKFTIPTSQTDNMDVAPPMKISEEEPDVVEATLEPQEEIVVTPPTPEPTETPDWLKAGLEQAEATGQNQVTPPMPEEAYETPAIPNIQMPAPETQPGVSEAELQQEVVTAPEPIAAVEPQAEPIQEPSMPEPAVTPVSTATTSASGLSAAEEKEQQRKREKRRRYRQNKRRRELEEKATPVTEPVAVVEPKVEPVEATTPVVEPTVEPTVTEEPTVEPVVPQPKAPAKKTKPKPVEQDIQPASDEDVTFLISADSISDTKKTPKKKKKADDEQKA